MKNKELMNTYLMYCLLEPLGSSFLSPVAHSAHCGCFFPFLALSPRSPATTFWVHLLNKLFIVMLKLILPFGEPKLRLWLETDMTTQSHFLLYIKMCTQIKPVIPGLSIQVEPICIAFPWWCRAEYEGPITPQHLYSQLFDNLNELPFLWCYVLHKIMVVVYGVWVFFFPFLKIKLLHEW